MPFHVSIPHRKELTIEQENSLWAVQKDRRDEVHIFAVVTTLAVVMSPAAITLDYTRSTNRSRSIVVTTLAVVMSPCARHESCFMMTARVITTIYDTSACEAVV